MKPLGAWSSDKGKGIPGVSGGGGGREVPPKKMFELDSRKCVREFARRFNKI